ncbi:MAG: DUF58 domain-containing protein [Anaerovoracaceae bacterium]
MKSSRIVWAVSLILLLANYIFSEVYSGLWLLAAALVIPLISVIYTAVFCRSIAAEITMSQVCRKDEEMEGTLTVSSRGMLPVFRADICISVRNILTGQEQELTFTTALAGKHGRQIGFYLRNRLCGSVRITFSSVRVYDMFGIWKKDIISDFEYRLRVLPDVFPVYPHIMPGLRSDCESIEYSAYRSGSDMSEVFGIREYREGDSIRNIHWKLTGKCDDIMIKLPSLPVENSVMLMLETGLAEGEAHTPYVYDAMAEIYVTLSQTLTDSSIPHSLAWYDRTAGSMFCFDIISEDDLSSVMDRILSAEHGSDSISVVDHYMTEKGAVDKAHLIYVTPHQPRIPAGDLAGTYVTAIVCSDERKTADGMTEDGISVITCTPQDHRRVLHDISI